MDDSAMTGAMTEIALALAMAFFCLLVLTLVSMGNPGGTPEGEPATGAAVPAGTLPRLGTAERAVAGRPLAAAETLVLFHGGRFLDRDGGSVTPSSVSQGAVVLAVDPSLPLDAVLDARARFNGPNVTITPLDPAWVEHLSNGGSR